MLKIIRNLLAKIIDDIDAGNSNITEDEAIKLHYHDYCELFKAWFGDGIDQKIIESAIIFWFKDDDHREGSKLWNYFKEN